jgi:alpha-ribazole phosphatase
MSGEKDRMKAKKIMIREWFKMQLYLVRHGATELNEKQVYQGWTDAALSETGRWQCELVRQKLRGVNFDVVLCSPLERAVSSAELISGLTRERIRICEALKEINFGIWEGLSYQEVERQYPQKWQAWCNDWQGCELPRGESFTVFYQRVKSGWEELQSLYHDKTLLIVSHAGPLRVIAGILLHLQPEDFWRLSFEFGCYSRFEFVRKTSVLKKLNC